MRKLRGLIGLAGVALAVVGVMKLLALGLPNLEATVTWLLGGVIVHDGVLAPLVVILGVLVVRVLPVWARTPVVVGFVVLGTTAVMAFPVLGRFGARPDNLTLLDRNYTGGWLVLAALVAVAVVAGCWWNRRHLSAPQHLSGGSG